jgi:hypothetical protein
MERRDNTIEESRDKTIEKKRKKTKDNARRNKEYRERHGGKINTERREKRINEKAGITPAPLYDCDKILKPVDKLPKRKEKEKKAENTKSTYRSFIRQFYKRMTGEDLEEDDEIIKSINEEKYSAMKISKKFKGIIEENMRDIVRKPYEVNNLYKILREIKGFTEICKGLYAYVLEYAKQYEEKRSVVIVEDMKDLEVISFKQEDIVENLERIINRIDKIIYGYIFMIRGRMNDMRITRIARDKEETTKLENNYIYENKLYINSTKNGKGNIIELPGDFIKLYEGIPEGYLLGGLIAQSTLSQRLQRIMKELYGKSYTYLNIRHINATQINARGASLKEREETSERAGHSVEQQMRYVYKVESKGKRGGEGSEGSEGESLE